MIKKSDIVRKAIQDQDWKKALQIAKDFHIGVTQEQRNKMVRAYECIVHPDFYQQIGIDIPEAIEQGKAVVKEYMENARRKNIMKWDVKHDLAKRVIDAFLEGAIGWQQTGELTIPNRNDLVGDLTEEEKQLVSEELGLMVTSIRKRYKLQERLPEQEAQIQPEKAKTKIPTEKAEKTLPEPVNEAEKEEKPEKETASADTEQAQESSEKPKRSRKASGTEKKPAAKRGRKKKTEQEENAESEQETV